MAEGVRLTVREEGAGKASAALRRVMQSVGDARPMWDEIGGHLEQSTQRRFRRGEAPSGGHWRPSRRVLRKGGLTLVDTSRLLRSITSNAFRDRVEVGSNVIYATIHQLGGKAGRKRAATIPARPYLGLDRFDRDAIREIAAEALARALRA